MLKMKTEVGSKLKAVLVAYGITVKMKTTGQGFSRIYR